MGHHSTATIRMKYAESGCQYCLVPILRGEKCRRYHGRGQYAPYVHESCAKAMEGICSHAINSDCPHYS